MIAFVLVSGTTWSLLNGPAKSSADPCPETSCAAPVPRAPAVRETPLRVVVYDPALEPLRIAPWDSQTHSGPEAPVRNQTPVPERTSGSGGRHER